MSKSTLIELVRAFYNAIGAEAFGNDFRIRFKEKEDLYEVILEMKGHDLSSDWENTVMSRIEYMVGEYEFESRDWAINAVGYKEYECGYPSESLGYGLRNRKDDGWTRLTLKSDLEHFDGHVMDEVLLNLFYKENRLFGHLIAENKDISVYERSQEECPTEYTDSDFKGILYIDGFARARIDIPVVVNINANEKEWMRDSKPLYSFEANRLITYYAEKLDGRSSFQILTHLPDLWFDLPQSVDDVDTWYYFICNLVRNVANDEICRNEFMERFPGMYYVERLGIDEDKNGLIEEVIRHARANGYEKWLGLNPVFRLLGARSLRTIYETRRCKHA